ncbi:SpaA isopeptide-forming pilin-related protein [uncultured Clostridium sp.]|uniref:isopeptide-forming domain-containing fimbrial protein n=1 Tax=uncultured Clostridium sp. TaxID=59620 RepID=UPI002730F41A|nr:SpaA isopeptide-forming pilin-related protein [uncultured Clostridium sp.]
MLSKKTRKVFSTMMLTGVLVTQISSLNAYAEKNTSTEATAIEAVNLEVRTNKGVANLGRGSAEITIEGNKGQSLVGKKFNVYKIFDAENSVGLESIRYIMNPIYAPALVNVISEKLHKSTSQVTEYEIIDYIQSLNTNKAENAISDQPLEGRYSDFRYFVEDLRDEIRKLNIKGDVVTVTETKADNSVVISGLDYGYYIIDEVTAVDDTHSASSLCMVNTANPNAEVQIKSDYPSVIKKIQEDDKKDTIGNDGWNDIADFEIGQTVPYKFESNVPNMNGYDTYYYAWHDKMDEALTFNKNSVGIKIVDSKGKTYTLQNNEFNVVENPGMGETFKVVISDLKALVDREFNNKNGSDENVYGQKVILTFNATLNDKAANDTGRPGFENDVRLEFSNDPDSDGEGSTGFTPWDTVVCFTFKINGLKTNDQGLKLEGAKFRLYSDKECKNEVYVKKSDQGYIVINEDSTNGSRPADAVEMVSDANGEFNIIGLDQGTYYLKEPEAPAGYRPLLDPIEINVVPTYTTDRNNYIKGDGATDKTLQTLEATAKIKSFYSGIFNTEDLNLTTDVNEGSANLTVVNKVGAKLPITGSSMTLLMMAAGTGIMTYSLKRKKK